MIKKRKTSILAFSLAILCFEEAFAQSIVPARPIRAYSVVAAEDVILSDKSHVGSYEIMSDVVGYEAKVTLYPGRPIKIGDIGPVSVIERNQNVTLVFSNGQLSIKTTGRALDRAAIGESVRVMNLASRTTVVGVALDGSNVMVTE